MFDRNLIHSVRLMLFSLQPVSLPLSLPFFFHLTVMLLHREPIYYLVYSPLICPSLRQSAVIKLIQCPWNVQATIIVREKECCHYF